MDVMAKKRGGDGRIALLHVRSNWLGALHWGHSIHAVEPVDPMRKSGNDTHHVYVTVSDFLAAWDVIVSKQVVIRLPLLRHKMGLGTVVGAVLSFLHINPSGDCGCPDRKTWLNWLVAFEPWHYHGEDD